MLKSSHIGMGIFENIFDSFSRRTPNATAKTYENIPPTTRVRITRWCVELYGGERPSNIIGRGDHNSEFWLEIYRRLLYRTGKTTLTSTDRGTTPMEAANYLLNCSTAEFLDFLEDIFNNDIFTNVSLWDNKIVDEMNTILRQDNLPYAVTHFVVEEVVHTSGMFSGHRGTQVRSYPKVILKESEVLDQHAIGPALQLLSQPHFASANKEFLAALEDYRKGDMGDCLVKCGSSFESVLKIICDRKGWAYNQNDTASTLVKTIIANTSLENYFEPMLIIVATLRNRLSSAHGAGTTARQTPRHLAHYALNMTASAILMLTEETGV
jgi:AbiJ N-terminal domain 4